MSSESNEYDRFKLDAERFWKDPEYAAAHVKATNDEIYKALNEPTINEGHREAKGQLLKNVMEIKKKQIERMQKKREFWVPSRGITETNTSQQPIRVYVADPEDNVTTYDCESYPEATKILKQKSEELRNKYGSGILTEPTCHGFFRQSHENGNFPAKPGSLYANSWIFVRPVPQSNSVNPCWEAMRSFFEVTAKTNV